MGHHRGEVRQTTHAQYTPSGNVRQFNSRLGRFLAPASANNLVKAEEEEEELEGENIAAV